jgi:DNA-binding winged helix-turn-helix (wHTH) protein
MDPSPLCFDRFQLDLAARELRCAGAPCALEPRMLDVLAYLIEQKARAVPSAELIRRVWKLRRLGASSVPTAIGALRRALGDDPRRPRFIRTVPRAGYRFVAELRDARPAPSAREPEWDALHIDPVIAVQVRPLLARVASLLRPAAGERPLVLVIPGAAAHAAVGRRHARGPLRRAAGRAAPNAAASVDAAPGATEPPAPARC